MDDRSIVQYIPKDGPDNCGYCKTKKKSKKLGMWAFQLTVEDYQNLIDRGWRRSGHYCYKPILSESCCALYTIRCDATEFKLSRSQKRILKNANNFIRSGEKRRNISVSLLGSEINAQCSESLPSQGVINQDLKLNSAAMALVENATSKPDVKLPKEVIDKESSRVFKAVTRAKSESKAKQIRINRKRNKLLVKGLSEEEIAKKMVEKKRYPVVKTIDDFINVPSGNSPAHNLEVRLVRSSPPSSEFLKSFEVSYELYCKYQIKVHKDEPSSLTCDSFKRFLVESPLIKEGDMGSFHQQYWLDGKLIAVGVLDILPVCVSSVYLYYDPDFAFLSMGAYSSLREIHLVQSLTKTYPLLKFYYMGFYIHTCPKMKYKGSWTPSYLLCPEVYSWHPIKTCLEKIDKSKYSRLNEHEGATDDNKGEITNQCLVIYDHELQLLKNVPHQIRKRNFVQEYLTSVGAHFAPNAILQLK